MKSLKKTLVLLVVFSMILSTLVPAFAFSDVDGLDCENQVTRMVALGIIEGFAEDGTFRPDETVTRAQMAVIIGKMVGITAGQAEANANVASKFNDVASTHWANGWINLASNNGIISGYPDGTFRPEQTLTLNEVLTLCVKALGRGGYVDKMGTWPANYVTEAARLNLLKDVKTASVATRGNVAVICWNTLGADTWYVNSETLDGEVNLNANDNKSLLEINFEEYTHENSTEVANLKEVEATVVSTPARNTEIGERQIVLDFNITENGKYDFDFKQKTDYKKAVREEKTFTTTEGIVAYVPEEVFEDIDTLRNKNVTIVFGEDNIVALIIVEDDTISSELLTKYKDNEITVGGEEYELADEVEVIVNDTPMDEYVLADEDGKLADATAFAAIDATKYTYADGKYTKATAYADATTVYYVVADQLADALKVILGSVPTKAFDKAIEAELTLNEDEEVEKIDLFVSGNYNEFNTKEAVVTRVKSEKIETTVGNITWDEDEYEATDYPRVYIDGVKSEITDIEAGDVLTIFGYDTDAEDINVIYASRQTVTGEVSRIKNKVEIYVDGEVYLLSDVINAEALNLDGELKELSSTDLVDDFKSLHGEEATLHLNVLGEYVLVNAETVDSDWQFAVVDHIYDAKENEEDEDLYSQQLRVVTMDGSKVRSYSLVYDASDYEGNTDKEISDKVVANAVIKTGSADAYKPDPDAAKNELALSTRVTEGALIAFKANADGEIELDEVYAVNTEKPNSSNAVIDGYKFIALAANYGSATSESVNFDTKRIDHIIHVECEAGDTGAKEVMASGATGDAQINLEDVIDADVEVGEYVKESTVRFKVTEETKLLDMASREEITWKNLVDEKDEEVAVDTILVYEEDSSELSYVIALTKPSATSDVEYAVVIDATYTISKTKTGALLLGVDGTEYAYEYDNFNLTEGELISFEISNDKLTNVIPLADLGEATDAEDKDAIVGTNVKGAYKVESFDGDYLTYTDDEDTTPLANRFVDVNVKEVIVVSYNDDTMELTRESFDAETLEGEYVLHFNENTDGYELLVIIK